MRRSLHYRTIALGCTLIVGACTDHPAAPAAPDSPRNETATASEPLTAPLLRVLGTAQDGGLPHAACEHELCRRARLDPSLASHIASLGLILPRADGGYRVYLVDTTPDVRAQLDMLRDVRELPDDRVDRAPVDGVLLTHAHIGHYLGLAFFGFEAVHTQGLRAHVTPRMAGFLRTNGPWDQLVEKNNIAVVEHELGEEFALGEAGDGAVAVSMIPVPHRDEYSDTVGFVFEGPNRRALYVPDTDGWAAWDPQLLDLLDRHQIDVAVLDATFYSLDELPGRDVTSVRHPLVVDSMDLLEDWVAAGGQVIFSHLNHSNPALDPSSEARRAIEARGFSVAEMGLEIGL